MIDKSEKLENEYKNLVISFGSWFCLAFLPQFISGDVSNAREIVKLGILNLAVIFTVMLFYGVLSKRFANIVRNKKIYFAVNKILGVSFISFGLSLFRFEQSK